MKLGHEQHEAREANDREDVVTHTRLRREGELSRGSGSLRCCGTRSGSTPVSRGARWRERSRSRVVAARNGDVLRRSLAISRGGMRSERTTHGYNLAGMVTKQKSRAVRGRRRQHAAICVARRSRGRDMILPCVDLMRQRPAQPRHGHKTSPPRSWRSSRRGTTP